MSNNNTLLQNNQACKEKKIRIRKYKQDWQQIDCWPTDDIVHNKDKFFTNLNPKLNRLLNTLIYLYEKNKGNVFVLQRTLASLVGISRKWCSVLLLRLEKLGLIVSNYRHMQSCQYKLSSWFGNPYVKSALSHIFKALRIGILASIFPNSAPAQRFKQPFTHIEVRNNSLFKSIYLSVKYNNRNSLSTKRIVTMNAENIQNNQISITIREITCLSLTKWGQIRLSAFPDSAIKHAIDAFRFVGKLKSPFAFFFSKCQEYCKNNIITPDWQFSEQLALKYKQPYDAPMLLQQKQSDRQQIENKKEDTKKHTSQPAPEWKQEQNSRFRPMKHTFGDYPGMRPEQKVIQENFKKFSDKQQHDYDNLQIKDASRNFLSGCQINHEKEFDIFFSAAGKDNLNKQSVLFGEKTANGFFERMIQNHFECQKTNHNQPLSVVIQGTFDGTLVEDGPSLIDYSQYEEDYSDVVLEL